MAAFQAALGSIQPKSMDVKVYQIEKELDFENHTWADIQTHQSSNRLVTHNTPN